MAGTSSKTRSFHMRVENDNFDFMERRAIKKKENKKNSIALEINALIRKERTAEEKKQARK